MLRCLSETILRPHCLDIVIVPCGRRLSDIARACRLEIREGEGKRCCFRMRTVELNMWNVPSARKTIVFNPKRIQARVPTSHATCQYFCHSKTWEDLEISVDMKDVRNCQQGRQSKGPEINLERPIFLFRWLTDIQAILHRESSTTSSDSIINVFRSSAATDEKVSIWNIINDRIMRRTCNVLGSWHPLVCSQGQGHDPRWCAILPLFRELSIPSYSSLRASRRVSAIFILERSTGESRKVRLHL